ncbi:sugar O-acetyltransferase [Bacteroides stercorirosoris]|uniref:Nodulation protein L n=1 Tax=Bacteroides stercorirosoris TaxID=871324 RepID=A0A1M6HG41_9BACE|nr:sugar O-acetyltransferase [Bacteroides stercorirosoris]SHJ21084.1 galactoside O-acetyltransferase/maltose O-acetyltransferase [Bacteroides stercorirosoris]
MKTEYQKCMDGEPFDGSSPELVELTLQTKRLLRQLRETDYADDEAKKAIYKLLFGSIGNQVSIDIDFRCEYGKNIHIGNQVIINMNCTFLDNGAINIGDNVMIAPDVKIYTATHSVVFSERMPVRSNPKASVCDTIACPVTIESGVWIGGGAVILPGVTVGRNSVIGAGSVVTKSIPANSIAVGNPCRVIKSIDNEKTL